MFYSQDVVENIIAKEGGERGGRGGGFY